MSSAATHPHVALVAFPFGTHAAPLFIVARALAAASPGSTFSFLNSARSNRSLARGSPMGNLRVYDMSDGCPEGYSPAAKDPEEEVRMFLRATPGNIKEGIAAAVEGDGGTSLTCLVTDAFLWVSGEMAAEMGIPWVSLWTGGTSSLMAHLYTDKIRETIGTGEQGRENKPLDFLHPYMSPLRVSDLPGGIVSGNLSSTFTRLLHRMADELPKSSAVALNTFAGLDPALDSALSSKFKLSLPIGPLNLLLPPPPLADPFSCLAWLDRQPVAASVTYVSFGTLISPPPSELAQLVAGLEASGGPFLISLRKKNADLLHPHAEGKGMVVEWAPQAEVLKHRAVGAFVTHCGWNSVMESVAGGVPMVCRPFLGDQGMNTGVVSRIWGVGVELEGGVATMEGVVGALDRVLRGEEGRRMRERAAELGAMAVSAVESGGSSARNFDSLLGVIFGH